MPSRLICAAILIYWSVAALGLIRRDLLPELSVGNPPDFRTIASQEDNPAPVVWKVQVLDNPAEPENLRLIGQATTESRRRNDGWVEMKSFVRFDSGKLLKGTPFANRTDEQIEITSTYRIDPSGNLQSFHTGVRAASDPEELVKIDGVLKSGVMEVASQGPINILNRKLSFDYQPRGLVQSQIGALDRLPGLQIGQSWDEHVANPMTGQVELVRAEVKGKSFIHWNNNPVATLEVLHHSKTLSARTWVALDGMVLRQEIPFPLLRLVLERRPPKARPRGLEPPPLSSSDVSPRSSRP